MNPVNLFPSRRLAYLFGFVVCASLMGYALYLQYVEMLGTLPHVLVPAHRAGFFLGVVFLVGAVLNPRSLRRPDAGLGVAGHGRLGRGAGGAASHIQSLPADQLPSCGMGISYMLETLPFLDVFRPRTERQRECNKIDLILGLPIPAWNLLFFLAPLSRHSCSSTIAPTRRSAFPRS